MRDMTPAPPPAAKPKRRWYQFSVRTMWQLLS